MFHHTAAEVLGLRNAILSHATVMNPYPRGRLALVTYPAANNRWNVRVLVVTQEPHEVKVLAHVDDGSGEMAALREMLNALQRDARRILGVGTTGDVFRFNGSTEGG
jgi:hypothetical protein